MNDNFRGAFLMMGSMAAFTLNDACMKSLAGDMPLTQAVSLRGIATTILIYALARHLGALKLRLSRRDRLIVLGRNVMEIGTAYFFITALFNMPIANATAILQALPLTVTLAGAVLLGQAVGWRRLSAILIGLSGVMLIVRPGMEGFNVYSLYALGAVVMVTFRDILSRKLSKEVPSITVALSNALSVTVAFGLASIFTDWQPLTASSTATLAAASVFILGGYLFSVAAMRVGEIAVIAPFRYTGLLWALMLGLLVFGEWPDALTFLGAGIVVATGVYTFYRERALSAAAAQRAAVDKD